MKSFVKSVCSQSGRQLLASGLLCLAYLAGCGEAYAERARKPPNVVIFLIDELRFDEASPEARQAFVDIPNIDALARQGALFKNFYTVSPLCSPSRASILTGQYPATHGVTDNTERSLLSRQLHTFAIDLRSNGYETAFLGKWHMGNDPQPRPGFDYWAAIPGQGRLWDPEIWQDGQLRAIPGYVTDVLTDRAVTFLRKKRNGPFLLYLSHKAIHPDARQKADSALDMAYGVKYEGAPRHRGRYDNEAVRTPPSVQSYQLDPPGKPVLARALRRKRDPQNVAQWGSLLDLDSKAETLRKRAEMLLSIDEGVGRIVEEIRKQGQLDNTLIVFTSDNGTSIGEHGLTLERRLPYEETIHLPLIVYYKGWLGTEGKVVNDLALNIDIAPTVLEAANITSAARFQGRSLGPLLRASAPDWRRSFMVEHSPDERPFPWVLDMSYLMLRHENLKFIHWVRYPGEPELYDLAKDPFEQTNLIADPAYAPLIPRLRQELGRLVLETRGL